MAFLSADPPTLADARWNAAYYERLLNEPGWERAPAFGVDARKRMLEHWTEVLADLSKQGGRR
jgi:hypothetical protein